MKEANASTVTGGSHLSGTRYLWLAYLLLGLSLAGAFFLFPGGGFAQIAIYLGLSAMGIVAIAWAISRHQPENPLGWRVLLVGQVFYLAANVPWYLAAAGVIGALPYPSYVDALFNAAYVLLVVGMAILIRDRSKAVDPTGFLDTAIVVSGLGLPAFLFLMLPYLDPASFTIPQIVVSLSYPVMDLLMTGAVLRLLFLASARSLPAVWFLGLSFASLIPADTLYGISVLNGFFRPGHPMFLGWLLSYVFIACAALHPSMRDVAQPPGEEEEAVSRQRLALLGFAAVLPPILVGYREVTASGSDPAVVVGTFLSALVFVFALVRTGRLMSDIQERRQLAEALGRARDEALSTSRMKSEFLATMSHEIRTPMNAVIGLTGLLLETPLDDRQREYADGVRKAGEGLLSVINDILDFSKIEAGRLDLEMQTFDAQKVLDDVADLVAETARHKSLDVYSYLHPEVPRRLIGDAGRVRQILLNLMGNAVKFTSEGEVVAKVQLDPDATNVPEALDLVQLRVEVSDTGPGLDEAQQARLFEAFSQVDSSPTRRFEGTGLGLAISKRLVERMGGRIGVNSRPGAGSTFWFTIALSPADDHAQEEFAIPLKGLSLLLVDDNPTNRLILEHQLRAWDLDPVCAAGGREALALADERGFDLAILDLEMPDMDGAELASRMRAGPHAGRPIIMLTSADDMNREDAARKVGVDLVLRKPVRQSHLYDALLRTCLTQEDLRGRLQIAPAPEPAPLLQGCILLVEDNPANQLVGSRMVERLGCSVEVAANGYEAVAAVARRGFTAILMDCQMPEMDGYEATRRIRAGEGPGTHVPIIAMTASALQGDRERALAAGMDDYVTKPVGPADLRASLIRLMDPAAAAKSRATPDAASQGRGAEVRERLDADRWTMLESLFAEDPDGLKGLAEAFAEASGRIVGELSEAVCEDDLPRVELLAHNLDGCASNVGAIVVTDIAVSLERGARAGDREGFDEKISLLKVEVDLARLTIADRLQKDGG